jgi:hypothetical protein
MGASGTVAQRDMSRFFGANPLVGIRGSRRLPLS